MAINKISGNILQDNLQRGTDLSIQGNLIYFDVGNDRVGVLTSSPQDDFNVVGTANATDVRITSSTSNGIFFSDAAKLAKTTANLTWDGDQLYANAISTTELDLGTGNITAGNITITGNATVGNISVANITTTGNITGDYVIANAGIFGSVTTDDIFLGNITANGFANITGNITGGNIDTGGTIIAIGNITGGNIDTGGEILATGNVTGGNLNTLGNAVVGNILTDNYLYANGAPVDFQQPAGANTEIQYNNDNDFGASSNFTYDQATNILQVGYGSNGSITTDSAVVTGNIGVGNVNATANVSAGYVIANTVTNTNGILEVSAQTDVIFSPLGNVSAGNNYVTNLLTPVIATDAATKQYVDDAVSTGLTIHSPVYVETPTTLPAATYAQGGSTYTVTDTVAGNVVVFSTAANLQPNDQLWFSNSFQGITANTAYFVVSAPNTSAAVLSTTYNGIPVSNITSASGLTESVRVNSGQGATLTANASGSLTVDGISLSNGQRVLVYNQSPSYENGVYVVTDAGNISAPWILTRSSDANTYRPEDINGLDAGDYFYVQAGNTGAGESYVLTAPIGPIILGYNGLTFTQFSASQVYQAGNGLALVGTTFNALVDSNALEFNILNEIAIKAGANLITPNIGNAVGNSLTLTGNIVAGNLSVGIGEIIGGNINISGNATAGDLTVTANITSGNIINLGTVDSTGNITTPANVQSNYLIANSAIIGNVTITDLSVANIDATGYANIVGNVTGGNFVTAGLISATGNISGGNLNTAGNAVVGNILTDNYCYANGAPVDFQQPAGSNTQIQYNNDYDFGASANLTYDQSTGILQVGYGNGGAIQTDGITVTGNISSGNITITANVTSGNIINLGTVDSTGNISTPANVQGNYLIANSAIVGNVTISDLSVGNIDATGYANIIGNVIGGNLITLGNAVVGGIKTDNYYYANGAPVDFEQPAGANTQIQYNDDYDFGANVNFTYNYATGVLAVGYGSGGSIETDLITVTGNISANNATIGNALYTGTLQTTGNTIIGGNLTVQGNVTYINVETFDVEDPIIMIGTGANDQPLVTDDGKDRGLAMDYYNTGLAQQQTAFIGYKHSTSGNIILASNVTIANEIVTVIDWGTVQGGNAYFGNALIDGVATIATLDIDNLSVPGNIIGGNIISNALITGVTLDLSGNATVGNLTANADITATETIYSNNSSTSNDVYVGGLVTVTGNIIGGNLVSNAWITGVDLSISNSATITANITTGNISVSGNVIGGNVISNALITGVTLDLSGNATVGNLTSNADITATETVYSNNSSTSNNVYVGGLVTVTGNIIGGNLTSNAWITGIDLLISNSATVTANITAGNISVGSGLIESGNLTVVANITSGNIINLGSITSTGNIITPANVQGDYLIANSAIVGNVTITDLSVGNIDATGYANIAGNVTGGNLITLGNADVGGIRTDNYYYANGAPVDFEQPAGANTEIQYNDNSDFGASANLTYDWATGLLAVGYGNSGQLLTETITANTTAVLGNIVIANTTITTDLGYGNITINPTGNALAIIDTTSGLVIPVGDTAERPAPAPTGTLRFNVDINRVEIYDGSGWEDIAANITNQLIYGDNSTTVFVLDRSSTTAAVLVCLNGIVQVPNLAYTVAGNSLTFAQAPVVSDIIDIRFL